MVYIVSTTPNTPNQNTWIEYIKATYYSDYNIPFNDDGSIDFEKAKELTRNGKFTVRDYYSSMDLRVNPDIDIIYGGLDHNTSKTQISKKLDEDPNANGLMVLTTNAGAASYESITEKGLKGKTIFGGICVPTDSKEFLESGVMTSDIIWQPFDLGYLAVNVAVDAMTKDISNPYVSKLSGTAQVENRSIYSADGHKVNGTEIFLGAPAVFTKENADSMKK